MATVQSRVEGTVVVLDPEGNCDGGPDSRGIHEEVKTALQEGHKKILLNLSLVPWVNSPGLSILIACYVSVKREGASIRFCGLSDRVRVLMEHARMIPEVFETFATEREALESFSLPGPHESGNGS